MKTLNLTDLEKSDIKYKISKFPDGQQNVNIDLTNPIFWGVDYSTMKIQIKSRLNNFKDLELVICATKSLRSLGIKDISLYTPYFLGSRSDRKFEIGGNNYLKDVICPIINSLEFSSVTTMDPHSYVLEACLNNFKTEDIRDFYKSAHINLNLDSNNTIIVCPDAGAQKRAQVAANQMGIDKIIICSKERDKDGKLNQHIIPIDGEDLLKDIIIVDDICDGAATFMSIGGEIMTLREKQKPFGTYGKIYLIVTHGIFSKGFGQLQQYFDGIYTTNSYQDLQVEPFVKQFKVM